MKSMLRSVIATTLAVAALAAVPSARADERPGRTVVAPVLGAWMPTGDARDDFDDAPLAGVQVAYDVDPHLGVVATFTWAPTHASGLEDAHLDLFQADLGLRGQHAFALGRGVALQPFAGVGVGVRTYAFRDARYEGGTGFAWYVGGGAEVRWRALTAGLTARHELMTPDAPALEGADPGHDVALFASVGLRF